MEDNRKLTTVASCMMLIWLAIYLLTALLMPEWNLIFSMVGCVLPLYVFKKRFKAFGISDFDSAKYSFKQYFCYAGICISGAAIISFITALVMMLFGNVSSSANQNGFWFSLVFFCVIPAVFEELLLRCGVLGALRPLGSISVFICGAMFALMHISPTRMIYALYSGILISILVYLTNRLSIGIALHFVNNFCALLLSYVSGFVPTLITLIVLLIILLVSIKLIWGTKIFNDSKNIFSAFSFEKIKELLTPAFYLYLFSIIGCVIVFYL